LEQNKKSGTKRISAEDMESFTQLLLKQKNAAVLGAMHALRVRHLQGTEGH
jgi:hypothetical protein